MNRLIVIASLAAFSGAAYSATTDLDHTFPLSRVKQAKPVSLRMVYEQNNPSREKALADFCAEWIKRVAPEAKGVQCQSGVDEPASGKRPEVRHLFAEVLTRGGVTFSVPGNVRKNLLHYTIDGVAFVNWNASQDEVTLGLPLPGYKGKARTGDH